MRTATATIECCCGFPRGSWAGAKEVATGRGRSRDARHLGTRRHSTDIFFGPTPRGLESNWVPTDPNGRLEVLARFYGPEKPLFDKTWRLGDIERIQSR